MANTAGLTLTFLRDLLNGLQAFGTSVIRGSTAADSFKAALYQNTASISPATPAYTPTGEVSGGGYTAGGVAVTFAVAPAIDGNSAVVTPSASITYPAVTLADVDCLLLYNDTAAGKNSVGAYTFSAQTVVASDLVLTMPVNAEGTALIELFST